MKQAIAKGMNRLNAGCRPQSGSSLYARQDGARTNKPKANDAHHMPLTIFARAVRFPRSA